MMVKCANSIVLVGVLVAVCAVASATQPDQAQSADNTGSNSKNSTTKLQARISLERNNLDIDEKFLGQSDKKEERILKPSSTNSSSPTVTKTKRKFSASNGERSNRRLNNIWSLFLPGSSSNENDYDDENSAAAETDETGGSATSPAVAEGELMLSSPSGTGHTVSVSDQSGSSSAASNPNSSSSGATIIRPDQQPVQLITGAISKEMAPNMNDIVSNIMSSTSSTNESQGIRSLGEANLLDSDGEREDDESVSLVINQSSAGGASLVSNSSSGMNRGESNGSSDSFERWLSRIQFQDTPTTAIPSTSQATTTTTTATTVGSPWAQNATTGSMLQQPDFGRMAEVLRTQQQLGGTIAKQLQQRSRTHPPPTAFTTKGGHQSSSTAFDKDLRLAHFSGVKSQQQQHSNPLQQQLMRQRNSQLIHGIKFPTALASTISVSTKDGASNTSLSFANENFASTLSSIGSFNEMSQVVNSTDPAANISMNELLKDNSGQQVAQQKSVYQSQDEILRQVTSAINFEKQLNSRGQLSANEHISPNSNQKQNNSNSMLEVSQQQQQQRKQDSLGIQSGPSNFGWTPVQAPAGVAHLTATSPLISPAKLVKTRVKSQPVRILQGNDNVGVGKEFNQNNGFDDYYMNNLALTFASSEANGENPSGNNELQPPPPNQKIFGLPIAILKEDEIELHQAQLEAAAAAVAEQLSGSNKNGPLLYQQNHHHHQYFSHGLQPRAPSSDPLQGNIVTKNNEQQQQQRQAQQHVRRQKQFIPGAELILRHSPYGVTSDLIPLRPGGFVHEMVREPMITTTTITSGGPPLRVREVGLRRPFGFRSHHAIAYQASPSVSAMFPTLTQASQPSLLRHMTPFRAVATSLNDGGQRYLAPLMSQPAPQYQLATSTEQMPFINHHYLSSSPLRDHLFGAFSMSPINQHQQYAARVSNIADDDVRYMSSHRQRPRQRQQQQHQQQVAIDNLTKTRIDKPSMRVARKQQNPCPKPATIETQTTDTTTSISPMSNNTTTLATAASIESSNATTIATAATTLA